MTSKTVTKQLAGQQDILVGVGSVTQTRQSGTREIDRLDLIKPVTNLAALKVLVVSDENNLFGKVSLLGLASENDERGGMFVYSAATDPGTADDIDIVAAFGGVGAWTRYKASALDQKIQDTGNFYNGSSIEAALQELGAAGAHVTMNDVAFLDVTDSPITGDDVYNNFLLAIDTSAGAVVVNLNAIDTLALPYKITIKKLDATGNAISVVPGGTDLIDGVAATKTITLASSGATFVADDTVPDPDNWVTIQFGPTSGNRSVQDYTPVASAPGLTEFIPGTTTTLTMPADPGAETNIDVLFNGVTIHKENFVHSTTTIQFDVPIPLGTTNVEIIVGATLALGIPSDESVTAAKIATSDVVAIWDKIFGGAIAKTWAAIQTFSAGLKFGGGGDTLNHYTAPTLFTPILQGSSTPGAPVFSNEFGVWWRIGDIVFYQIDLTLSALGGMVGTLILDISNIGYGIKSDSKYSASISKFELVNLDAGYTAIYVERSTATVFIVNEVGDNVAANGVVITQLAATSSFSFSGSFRVA